MTTLLQLLLIVSTLCSTRSFVVNDFSNNRSGDWKNRDVNLAQRQQQSECGEQDMPAAGMSSSSSMTPPPVVYSTRVGTDEDVDLFALWIDKNREFHSAYNGETRTSALKFKKGSGLQALVPNLPNARVVFLLRDNNPDPIGFFSYNVQYTGLGTPPILYLQDIFIGEDSRGSGAGRFLMTEMVNIARKLFCSQITWNADRRNRPAVEFYERMGAETVGSTDNWLHMRLLL